MRYIYHLIEIGEAVALLSVLVLLLRGPSRKFWALLVYVVWELFSNVALTSFDLLYNGAVVGANASKEAVRWYSRLYWSSVVITDVLRFLLVIGLTYMATSAGPKRSSVGRMLSGIVVVALVLPFFLFPMFPNGPKAWIEASWFNSTSELLNFGAAIMNLVLWGVLIADRKRDPQLAVVSLGLGVVVTGAAISHGFGHLLSAEVQFRPNLFLMLTQLAGWGIWCRAFWPAHAPRPALDPAPRNAMPPA
jgi:hypothetical protein